MNALLAREARVQGGQMAGHAAAESGRPLEAAQKGGSKSRAIAARMRVARGQCKATNAIGMGAAGDSAAPIPLPGQIMRCGARQ